MERVDKVITGLLSYCIVQQPEQGQGSADTEGKSACAFSCGIHIPCIDQMQQNVETQCWYFNTSVQSANSQHV